MTNKIKITQGMFIALIINMVYAKAIGVTQGIMAREVGSDIWLSTIFSTLQGAAVMFVTVLLVRRNSKLDLFEQVQKLWGKWVAKLVALIVIAYFLYAFIPIMVTFVYHLKDYFLPEAPVVLFIAVGLFVGIYGCYQGLEVIGRMAFVGILFIFLLNILLLVGSYKDMDIQNLMPIFDSGFVPTLWASRHNNTDWSMAVMMAALVLPHVKNDRKWGTAGVIGILFGGLVVAMWPLLEVGVLSSEVTAQYIVACMQLARSAHLGYFIQRYEMIMIAFFAVSALIQVMVCLYCTAQGMTKLFGVRHYRKMILPSAAVLGGLSYWYVSNHIRAINFTSDLWPIIAHGAGVGLILLLWLLGLFRKKKLQT